MNIYWKTGVAIALLVVGFLAGSLWKQRELNQVRADYAEQANLGLQANRELERRLQSEVNSVATLYQNQKSASDKTIESLKKELVNAKKNHPMPANCRLDADRMRIIKAATNHANTVNSGS